MISIVKGATLAIAATMMVAAPAIAAPTAGSLSVARAPVRAGTATAHKSGIAEGSTATYISIGILAALVVIVLVATGGDDDDSDSN